MCSPSARAGHPRASGHPSHAELQVRQRPRWRRPHTRHPRNRQSRVSVSSAGLPWHTHIVPLSAATPTRNLTPRAAPIGGSGVPLLVKTRPLMGRDCRGCPVALARPAQTHILPVMPDWPPDAVWLKLGAEPGLCRACRHAKLNQTRRGTAYLRCTRAAWGHRACPLPASASNAMRGISAARGQALAPSAGLTCRADRSEAAPPVVVSWVIPPPPLQALPRPAAPGPCWLPLAPVAGRDIWNIWGNPVTFARCVRYSRGAALAGRLRVRQAHGWRASARVGGAPRVSWPWVW
jgi:hypothetical protein